MYRLWCVNPKMGTHRIQQNGRGRFLAIRFAGDYR